MNKNKKYILIALLASLLLTVTIGFSMWIILSEQARGYIQSMGTLELKPNGPLYAGETWTYEDGKEESPNYATVTYTHRVNESAEAVPEALSGTFVVSKTEASGGSEEVAANVKVTFFPSNLFVRWVWGEKIEFDENVSVDARPHAISGDIKLKAVAQYGSSTYYTTIDMALGAANNADDGGTVFAIGSGEGNYSTIENNRAKIAKTIQTTSVIDSNVKLCIPYVNGQEMRLEDRYATGYNTTGTEPEFPGDVYVFDPNTMCVNQVVLACDLTNNGAIEVCGITGFSFPNSSTAFQGSTTGLHGALVIEGAELTMEISAASISVNGYIADGTNGKITAKSGLITMPFVIYDYAGGTVTVSMYSGGGNALGLAAGTFDPNIAPFLAFDMPNIQVPLTCYGGSNGATIKALASLSTGSIDLGIGKIKAKYNITEFNIFSNTGALFNMTDGYATFTYNSEKNEAYKWFGEQTNGSYYKPNRKTKTKIELNGTTVSGDVTLTVDAGLGETDVSLSSVIFPVSDKIELHFCGEKNYTFTSRYKFLPGSELHIEDGAVVTVNSDAGLVFYETIVTSGGVYGYYNTAKANTPAKCNIADGKLIVNGSIGGTLNAAAIAGGLDLTNAVSLSMASEEGNGSRSGLTFTYTPTQTINLSASGVLLSGNNLAGTSGSNFAANHYYSQENSASTTTDDAFGWYSANFDVTLNANGGNLPSGFTNPDSVTISTPGEGKAISDYNTNTNTKPTRDYYSFSHWCTSSTCTNGNECSSLTASLYDDTTLYAAWTPITYNLTYAFDYTEMGTQTLPDGEITNSNPTTFTVETNTTLANAVYGSLVFDGWYLDSGCTVSASGLLGTTLVNYLSDDTVTLYAKWHPTDSDFYTIYYINANGSAEYNFFETYQSTYVGNDPTTQALEASLNSQNNNPSYAKYFIGWSTTEGGTTVISSLEGVTWTNPDSNNPSITLYAVWGDKCAVTIDGASTKYYISGTKITLPTPDAKTGYTFLGWYDAASGGTKIGDAGDEYTVEGNITLYAQWSQNYTVTYNANGGTCSTPNAIYEGTALTLPTPTRDGYTFNGWYDAASGGNKIGDADASYTPTADITLYAQWTENSSSCIAAGTLITLADGTQKKVEDLTLDDLLLVFNHETGRYEAAGIIFIEDDGWDYYNVINLVFSDGTVTKLIYEHALFDLTLNKYVYITDQNYADFVGHEFAIQDGDTVGIVTLTEAFVEREYTGCYSLVTTYHLNYFIDGLFSIPGGIDGLFNIFEYGDGLKYDEEKMNADIEEFGLFTYEEFAQYYPEIPEEVYEMFPAKYFKVAIGKGMLTSEDILSYIEQFLIKNGII